MPFRGYVEQDDDGDDAADVRTLRTGQATARKDHACVYCQDPIRAGDRYALHVYTLDGEFRIDRAHLRGQCGVPVGVCPTCGEKAPGCACDRADRDAAEDAYWAAWAAAEAELPTWWYEPAPAGSASNDDAVADDDLPF
jgi:hypothetical protein